MTVDCSKLVGSNDDRKVVIVALQQGSQPIEEGNCEIILLAVLWYARSDHVY